MVGGTAVDCEWRVRKRTWAIGEHFRAPLEGAEGEVWVFCFVLFQDGQFLHLQA